MKTIINNRNIDFITKNSLYYIVNIIKAVTKIYLLKISLSALAGKNFTFCEAAI